MGSSFIITERMLKNKGRELMLDFFDNIHNEYRLKSFDEFKSQRKFYDENVVKIYTKFIKRDLNLREYKLYESSLSVLDEPKKLSDDEIRDKIKDEIRDKRIEIEFVFDFLSEMDEKLNLDSSFEFEIDEDHFCLKKAFLKAYDIFYHSGYNLKD